MQNIIITIMKRNLVNQKKKALRISKGIALVASLCFTGFSLSFTYGQVVTNRPATSTQQTTQQKTTTPREVTITKHSFKPVKVSSTELRNFNEAMAAKTFTSTQTLTTAQKAVGVQPIAVTWPENNHEWEAGNEYPINWSGANNDVRIDLVFLGAAGKPRTKYTITSRAPNTGSYRFRVPKNWLKESEGYKVVIETIDGKQSGVSQGTISVYTQPIDLECRVVGLNLRYQDKNYIVYRDKKKWLEYNVLIRNKGVQSPVTIYNILVRYIKQPENIVVAQEEWGFSGIYNHNWYWLPEPRKINISSFEGIPLWDEKQVNFEAGSYTVEVQLDPQNSLGELQDLRYDNKDLQPWIIKPDGLIIGR